MIDEKAKTDTEIAQRKIFIGGLSYSTDDEKLKNYFSVYGKVQDAVVMKDPVSKRSRGFGFITFTDIESVDLALAHEPHTIDARKVEAKRAVPRSEAPREISVPKLTTLSPSSNSLGMAHSESSNTLDSSPGQRSGFKNVLDPRATVNDYMYNKIFVGGLHYDTRDADFRSYFEKYGKIITAEVMFNRETHKSRGFGFIVYESEDGVNAVCDVKEHVINGKAVEVKRAIPRSKISSDSKSQGDNSYPASPITSPADSNYNLEKLLMSQHGSTNSLSQLNASSYASILKLGSDFLSNSQHGQQNMSQEAMLRNMLLNDSLGTNTDQLLHLMSIDAQNQINMKRAAAYAAATNQMNASSSSQYGSYDMLSNLNTQRKLSASMPASRSGSHDFTRGNDLWLPPQHSNTNSSSSLNYADPLLSYSTSSSSTNYLSNMDLYQDKSIQLLASSLSSRTNSVPRATTSRQYFDCVRNLNSLSTLPSSYFNTEQHGNMNMSSSSLSSSSLLPSQTIGNSSSLQDLPYSSTTAQMNSTPNTMNQPLNSMNNFPSYPSPKSLSPPSYLTPSLFSSHNTSVASLLSSPITNGSSNNNTHNNYNNNSTMLHATGNMNNSNNFTSNSFNIPSLSAWTDMITRSSNNTVNTMTTHESKASLSSTQQQQPSHPSCSSSSSSSSSAVSYSPFYSSSLGPLNTTSNINTTTTTATTTSVGISTDSSHGVIGGPSQRPHSASFSVIPQKLSDIWGTSNTVSSSTTTGLSSSYSGPSFTSLYESLMSSSSSTLTSPPPTTATVTTGTGTSQSYSSPSKSSKSLNDIVNSTLSNKINDSTSSVHMTSYTTTSLPQTPSPPPLLISESSQMDSIRMTPPSISMNPHPMDSFLSTIDTSSLLKLASSTTTSPYTPSRPITHGTGMLTTLLHDENIDNSNNMNLKDDSMTISLPESMSESSSQQDLTSALIHSTLKYLSTTPSSTTPNVTPNPAMYSSTAKSNANSTTTTPNRTTNDFSNMMNTTTTTPPPNTPTTTTTPTTNNMMKNDITDGLIYQYHGLNLNSQAFDPSKPYEWSSTKIA